MIVLKVNYQPSKTNDIYYFYFKGNQEQCGQFITEAEKLVMDNDDIEVIGSDSLPAVKKLYNSAKKNGIVVNTTKEFRDSVLEINNMYNLKL